MTPLTLAHLTAVNVARAQRWHPEGLHSWSPLEWAGAMAGECGEAADAVLHLAILTLRMTTHSGEACNAAKKLKRLTEGLQSINHDDGDQQRHFDNVHDARQAVGREVADTILYAVLLAAVCEIDLEKAVRDVFNKKSEEYGFPERL